MQSLRACRAADARPVVYGWPVSCISYTFLTAPALRTDLRLTSDRPICVWTYRFRKMIHSFSRNHVYRFENMYRPYTRQPVREVISICAGALLCMTGNRRSIHKSGLDNGCRDQCMDLEAGGRDRYTNQEARAPPDRLNGSRLRSGRGNDDVLTTRSQIRGRAGL